MKFNFKKISAIATSVLMTGMTVGTAMAAGIRPADLGGQGNFAIVYGSTANSMDQAQATAIDTALRNQFSTSTSVVVGDVALTDDEVTLGGNITARLKILPEVKNNKLRSLLKEKISWDAGSGDKNYDIYETIEVTDMNVLTTLNDSDLKGVALSNDKGIYYKLFLDSSLPEENVTQDNSLELSILGQEYELVGISGGEISVTTSSEVAMGVGQTYTLSNGKVVTLSGVFSGSVEVTVDGTSRIISETSTNGVKINNVRVKVESIGYNSNAPDTSKAVLKIGEDLTKTYSSGEEFIGEDEDDPEWVWDIGAFTTSTNSYIGVKYNYKIYRAKDDIKYVGEGYSLPNNYATVVLEEITKADYQEVKISFEEKEDLYNSTALVSPEVTYSQKVLVIEAENKDSISVGTSVETNKIAIHANDTSIFVYAYDNDGDYVPSKKMRAAKVVAMNTTVSDLAEIVIEDTTLSVGMKGIDLGSNSSGYLTIKLGSREVLSANISDLSRIDRFGDKQDDAEAGDVFFSGTDVSRKEYEYMDAYGIKISEGTKVLSEVDRDEVTLSVPEEQVFAKVSLSMGASTTSTGSVGNMIFRDTESSSYAGKNVVIVGGSCVNSAAATVLGVASDRGVPGCYADSGLSAGQFLIKKGLLGGKTAIVVAGYEADDTVKAAQFLINKGAVEGKYSSTTSEIIA